MQMADLNKEKILKTQEKALVRPEELFLKEGKNLASKILSDNDGDINVTQIDIVCSQQEDIV